MGGDTIVGSLVIVACLNGLDAVTYSSAPPYGVEAWTQPATNGPAVYGGGLIWSINVVHQTSIGTLYGLVPGTGSVKLQYTLGLVQNHFPTPSIGDNMVVVATETSVLGFPPA